MPAASLAGDEVYGADSKLRAGLHERAIGCVLAVACDHQVTTHAGKHLAKALAAGCRHGPETGSAQVVGTKGRRWYDWALIDVTDPDIPGGHTLLVRRISSGELAFHRCYTPRPVPLATLVAVVGRRWTIEESFPAGKGLTILAMLAHALLALAAVAAGGIPAGPPARLSNKSRGSAD